MAADTLFEKTGITRIPSGRPFTISVKGQSLILPTESDSILTGSNEYALDPNRVTGGGSLAGSEGGLHTPTAGVTITDNAGGNAGTSISAATLAGVGCLTVNTNAKTITEEFILTNTNADSTGSTVIDDCSATTGWARVFGDSWTLESVDGKLVFTATSDSANRARIWKDFGNVFNNFNFIKMDITSSVAGNLYLEFRDMTSNLYLSWKLTRFSFTAGQTRTFVFPIKAILSGTTGLLPNVRTAGTIGYNTIRWYLGIDTTAGAGTPVIMTVDNIKADPGTDAVLELEVPAGLAGTSLSVQAWNGSAYQTVGSYRLNSSYNYISGTPANLKLLNGDILDNIYTANLGRALYPKAEDEDTVTGSAGTLTYSSDNPGKPRIGLKVTLPPTSAFSPTFSQIRLKTVMNYISFPASGATDFEFIDTSDVSLGLRNLKNPWLALMDSSGYVEYYIFTDHPTAITAKRNAANEYYELEINPGNAQVLTGSVWLGDQTKDTNGDYIPDCISEYLEKMLSGYAFNEHIGKITLKTTGATFTPIITVDTGATILWEFGNGTTSTSATPSVNFGSIGTRTNYLTVFPWSALNTINVGYNGGDGGETPGGANLASLAQQNVIEVAGLQAATELIKWASWDNPVTAIDFSNLIKLEKIECLSCNNLATVTLTNVPALTRLCLEGDGLSTLDLSEAPMLADLRGASQGGATFSITWGTTGVQVWHICVQQNPNLSTAIPLSQFPLLRELIIANTGQTGTLDLTGNPVMAWLQASDNNFSSVLTAACPLLDDLYLSGSSLNEAAVDELLRIADTFGKLNGSVDLTGSATPSATGLTYKSNLISKNWTVTTE